MHLEMSTKCRANFQAPHEEIIAAVDRRARLLNLVVLDSEGRGQESEDDRHCQRAEERSRAPLLCWLCVLLFCSLSLSPVNCSEPGGLALAMIQRSRSVWPC